VLFTNTVPVLLTTKELLLTLCPEMSPGLMSDFIVQLKSVITGGGGGMLV
jgi:hypothetical protein